MGTHGDSTQRMSVVVPGAVFDEIPEEFRETFKEEPLRGAGRRFAADVVRSVALGIFDSLSRQLLQSTCPPSKRQAIRATLRKMSADLSRKNWR